MNDKQKWAIVILVGCLTSLLVAVSGELGWYDITTVVFWLVSENHSATINWTGCIIIGISISSIAGFFLFKDK